VTVADWLEARTPCPPAALGARIAVVLGPDALAADAADASAHLLAAGERLAATLLASGSTSRESALDLLTADALVTYAFEAASEAPADLAARASDAMARIASLGAR
jgi:hypothetical protein